MSFLISIITINLNNLGGLQKTISSVLSQDYSNIEYLIIDGGSIDGSFEYSQSIKSKLAYCVSEKDNGIYDAMNKGIAKAKGDYLLFLNSGDYFFSPKSLSLLMFSRNKTDIIYGNMGIENEEKIEIKKYPTKLDINYFSNDTIPHPCTLIRRELFLKYGNYRTDYKIISDWAFFIDMIIREKVSYAYVDVVVSVFNLFGISSQSSSYRLIHNEMYSHFKNHYYLFYVNLKTRWAIGYYPKRILEKILFYLEYSKSSINN